MIGGLKDGLLDGDVSNVSDSNNDLMDVVVFGCDDDETDSSVDLLEDSCVGKQVIPVSLKDFPDEAEMEVIDLTVSDDDIEDFDDELRTESVVWGEEASEEDIVQINKMLRTGVGVYGSVSTKLVVKDSLLVGAGRGVFVKEGCVINDGECITQYSGRTVRSTRGLSVKQQLRTIEIGKIFVVGKEKLVEGDGYGSLVNSSVVGRTISFCRFVSYKNGVYIMAYCKKPEYPLCGSMELYLTAGSGWWSLFNSVRGRK